MILYLFLDNDANHQPPSQIPSGRNCATRCSSFIERSPLSILDFICPPLSELSFSKEDRIKRHRFFSSFLSVVSELPLHSGYYSTLDIEMAVSCGQHLFLDLGHHARCRGLVFHNHLLQSIYIQIHIVECFDLKQIPFISTTVEARSSFAIIKIAPLHAIAEQFWQQSTLFIQVSVHGYNFAS